MLPLLLECQTTDVKFACYTPASTGPQKVGVSMSLVTIDSITTYAECMTDCSWTYVRARVL